MTFLENLSRRRIRFHRSHGDANEIQLCCPFCPDYGESADTRFRLSINIANGAGICFNCGYKSRHVIFALLKKWNIIRDLEEEKPEPAIAVEPVKLPKDFQLLSKAYDALDRIALKYLLQRGITQKQIHARGIGVSYCGRYAYRIVMPVWVNETLRGVVARDFTGQQKPKYLNSVGDKYLYGFDPQSESCILVEGIFKALRVELATGLPTAALLGHDLTPIQLKQIQESKCRKITLFPDPDLVGRRGVARIADTLKEEWSGELNIIWPVRTPADEMTLAALQKVTAQPYSWSLCHRLLLNQTE